MQNYVFAVLKCALSWFFVCIRLQRIISKQLWTDENIWVESL